MRSFVDLYLEYTKEQEAPSSFWRWSGYAAIAAIMRDNVYLQLSVDQRVYPNIFVILVAPSGKRKSRPIIIGGDLVQAIANTKLIMGRCSIEGITDVLAKGESTGTGKMVKGGSCLICAEELLAAFVSSDSLIPVLTNMYDFKSHYKEKLIGRESQPVKNLCVSMLAASNEPLLKEIYTGLAVNGGLLGRTFLIRPDEERPSELGIKTAAQRAQTNGHYDRKVLLESLARIAKLNGPIVMDDDAIIYMQDWYNKIHKEYTRKPDPSGIMHRLHTNVMKIAMILGVSTEYNLVVHKCHVEQAIDECLALVKNYTAYSMGTGKSNINEVGMTLLNELWCAENRTMSRREFLRNHWGICDADLLDKLKTTFEQAGHIKISVNCNISPPEETYTMTERCVEMFDKKIKDKK